MSSKETSPELSPREEQILRLAGEGHTDGTIAHRLGISEATVATYWNRIRTKLGPLSRVELVADAIRRERDRQLEEVRVQYQETLASIRDLIVQHLPDHIANFCDRLVEAAPDPILVVDREGTIQFVNSQVEAMFGYSRSMLVGKPLSKLIPADWRKSHEEYVLRYFDAPTRQHLPNGQSTYGIRADGTKVPIVAHLSVFEGASGPMATCLLWANDSVRDELAEARVSRPNPRAET